MRKLAPALILFFAFTSCKKDKENINTAEVRLLKVVDTNPNSATPGTTAFDYDQSGKITKVSSESAGTITVLATITYSGTDIIITRLQPTAAGFTAADETRYTVDAKGRPLKRIASVTYTYSAPNNPQTSIEKDTANFEYSSAGFLTKATGSSFDSTWFTASPGVTQTERKYNTFVTIYTQAGSNLTQIATTQNENNKATNSTGASVSFSNITESKFTFEYSKGYLNKTDYSNAAVIMEFGALATSDMIIDANYTNYPDKITYTSTTKAVPSGNVVDTENWSQSATAGYNSYGFIASLDVDFGSGSTFKRQIVYSK